MPKIAKKGTFGLFDVHKDRYIVYKYNNTVLKIVY